MEDRVSNTGKKNEPPKKADDKIEEAAFSAGSGRGL